MKKVIVLIAEGFEQVEALAPIDLLRRAGVEVVTAAIGNSNRVKSSHNVIIETDTLIEKLPLQQLICYSYQVALEPNGTMTSPW
jgi:4-methyl-5(b-hydroxyethyl)-thiazole monophosphate biosynthesis